MDIIKNKAFRIAHDNYSPLKNVLFLLFIYYRTMTVLFTSSVVYGNGFGLVGRYQLHSKNPKN